MLTEETNELAEQMNELAEHQRLVVKPTSLVAADTTGLTKTTGSQRTNRQSATDRRVWSKEKRLGLSLNRETSGTARVRSRGKRAR